MVARIAVLIVVAACGSKSAPGPVVTRPPANTPTKVTFEAPAVSDPGVIATDDSAPPVLVMIDARGLRSLAAAMTWKDLATGTLSAGPKVAGDEASYRTVKEGTLLGQDPKSIVDRFVNYPDPDRGSGPTNDPPPPDEDDSGGTGTAMALDEGKMSRKEAIEQARAAGLRPAAGARGARSSEATGNALARQASVVGEVTSNKLEHVPAVVIPHPTTKAAAVVKAVTELEAMIGVKHDGEIRPLRIQFHRDANRGDVVEASDWLEVRLATSGLTIEAVPSKATTTTWAHVAAGLKTALAEARDRRKLDASTPVDVLVAPEVDAQQLVDVLVALDRAGEKTIGLGLAPTGTQLALRGQDGARGAPTKQDAPAVPTVSIGNLNAQGDLDKEIIRRYVKRYLQKIRYCYEKELLVTPTLQGTVAVQFFIKPDGKVGNASGTGVSPAVSSCVADVIKAIWFPKPKGGGGVQVNYPFSFRREVK
jgi:hypothetical protein